MWSFNYKAKLKIPRMWLWKRMRKNEMGWKKKTYLLTRNENERIKKKKKKNNNEVRNWRRYLIVKEWLRLEEGRERSEELRGWEMGMWIERGRVTIYIELSVVVSNRVWHVAIASLGVQNQPLSE